MASAQDPVECHRQSLRQIVLNVLICSGVVSKGRVPSTFGTSGTGYQLAPTCSLRRQFRAGWMNGADGFGTVGVLVPAPNGRTVEAQAPASEAEHSVSVRLAWSRAG